MLRSNRYEKIREARSSGIGNGAAGGCVGALGRTRLGRLSVVLRGRLGGDPGGARGAGRTRFFALFGCFLVDISPRPEINPQLRRVTRKRVFLPTDTAPNLPSLFFPFAQMAPVTHQDARDLLGMQKPRHALSFLQRR